MGVLRSSVFTEFRSLPHLHAIHLIVPDSNTRNGIVCSLELRIYDTAVHAPSETAVLDSIGPVSMPGKFGGLSLKWQFGGEKAVALSPLLVWNH